MTPPGSPDGDRRPLSTFAGPPGNRATVLSLGLHRTDKNRVAVLSLGLRGAARNRVTVPSLGLRGAARNRVTVLSLGLRGVGGDRVTVLGGHGGARSSAGWLLVGLRTGTADRWSRMCSGAGPFSGR
ncbi:hypothetical protein GCM10009828_010600 [Actinoplanes couchii]